MNTPNPCIYFDSSWKIKINNSCILPNTFNDKKAAVAMAKALRIAEKNGKLFCQVAPDNKRFELIGESYIDDDELAHNKNHSKLDKILDA